MKKNYFSNNYSKQQKNNTYRLNTEPSYIPHKTEASYQKNHLSSQGTTGDTKYLQTEKNLSPKLIHKERPKQKDKKSNENKLYDLQHTLTINVKIIQDFLKPETLPQLNNQKIKNLQNKIEIISKLVNERQTLKKEKEKEHGKKLVNNQIFQEVKRRKEENLKMYKDTLEEYIGFSKKKDITIRKCHKKFNEIQIYIRRESQSFPKYKRIYANFSMDNFILENENMLRLKDKINSSIAQRNVTMPLLLKEIEDMKNKNNENNIKISTNSNLNKIIDKRDAEKKLEGFMLIGEDILKDYENRNFQIEQIFNKISYKCYKNYYNNVLKYYNLLDNSKSQINDNFVSNIFQQNSIDNNETNLSYLYFDVMNIGNNKSTFRMDDFSNILNSKFG